jgi:small membrane protein
MLLIQILIVSFSLFALTRTFLRFRKRAFGLIEFILWSGFWASVGVFVLAPGITQWLARILGVGRGADAVFYLGLVGLSYGFFRLYLTTRHQEREITVLVRKLALKQAEQEDSQRKAAAVPHENEQGDSAGVH